MLAHRASFANFAFRTRTPAILTIRVARELRIERATCKLRPIQTGRLLRDVIAEADREHLRSVGNAEVEGIGGVSFTQCAFLQSEDLNDGFLHGFEHLFERIGFLPGFFADAVGQVGHVEGGGVFRVCAAEYVAVGVEGEEGGHFAADRREVRDDAVVHEDVAAEDEGVAVYLRYDGAACRADVSEDALRFRVVAQRLEVEVVDGWRLGLVERGAGARDVLNVGRACCGVP